MAAYTPSLRLTLPVTGTEDGTWGDTVNNGITSLTDASIAGTATVAQGDVANYTLTNNSGATDQARNMFLNITGALTAARNVVCPAVSKLYFIKNSTTGGFAVTLKTSGGSGISVPAGSITALYCDGTNVIDAITYANIPVINATTVDTTNLEVTNIKAKDGTASITLADSTGVATINAAPILTALTASQAVFTNGSKALVSNAITGTGNVVMSTSPTLVTPALGTPSALVGTNITGTATSFTASNVTTNANLTGDVTSVGNATTLTNAPVIAKVLTGYVSGAGTVAATDSILQAIQKLNGNDATNANLTGAVISVGNATSLGSFTSANLAAALTDETGTGANVFATSPTLTTPALGTPSALVGTNITGTATSFTASNVTTNANLTGAVTSVGNATSLGSFTSANLAAALTDETGTGANVFATSPTLTTPALGTPSALVGTNITGTAAGFTAGTVTTNANLTGAVTSTGNATSLGSFTSANLAAALTDETGTGANVFATSPTLVTPVLGAATVTSVTFPDATLQNTAATGFGFKNRIINGAMVIDQRNAGAASPIPVSVGSGYILDRWRYAASALAKFTLQQNQGGVTRPAGFSNYLGLTSSAATAVAAGDLYVIQQYIEGFNTSDLTWGTASASPVTLSFRVYSSLTGTFGGALSNNNVGSPRSYPFSYSISVANTWTTVSVTIAGDTSGAWPVDNSTGISLTFGLGVGSTYNGTAGAWATANYLSATGATSVVGTSGATFYITGVQLEKGSTATAFDYRPFGTELALCQRYYFKTFSQATAPANNTSATGAKVYNVQVSSTTAGGGVQIGFPTTMRTTPATVTTYNIGAGTAGAWYSLSRAAVSGVPVINAPSDAGIFVQNPQVAADLTGDLCGIHFTAIAEL